MFESLENFFKSSRAKPTSPPSVLRNEQEVDGFIVIEDSNSSGTRKADDSASADDLPSYEEAVGPASGYFSATTPSETSPSYYMCQRNAPVQCRSVVDLIPFQISDKLLLKERMQRCVIPRITSINFEEYEYDFTFERNYLRDQERDERIGEFIDTEIENPGEFKRRAYSKPPVPDWFTGDLIDFS